MGNTYFHFSFMLRKAKNLSNIGKDKEIRVIKILVFLSKQGRNVCMEKINIIRSYV